MFIGAKVYWAIFFDKVHPGLSLGVTLALLGGGVLASLLWPPRSAAAESTAAE